MLKLVGIDVEAVSVGGLETCIELPGWNLAFDIGRCPPTAVRRQKILFTHAHMDHAGGVAMHAATRDLMGMSRPTYWVPRENHAGFERLMEAWRALDHSDIPCDIRACGPGDVIDLGGGRSAIPFRSPHRVPCQGYALVSNRKKLKDELVGLPGPELQRRRMAGEEISVASRLVEVAFTGDTLIEVVEREPLVREARLLIMEVTFLDDRVPVAAARGKGHVHLDEVIARAHLFQNDAILFTHFSARYGPDEIVRILDARLPSELRARVTPLLPPGPYSPPGPEPR
jgi:ribonuclease Z